MNRFILAFGLLAVLFLSACASQEQEEIVLPKEPVRPPQATQPGEGGLTVGVPAPVEEPPSLPVEETVKEVKTVASETSSPDSPVSERPVREFSMTAKRFEFDPSVIEVDKGDEVVIRIRSLDTTHGFALDAFGVSERVDSNEREIRFVADKGGTFPFYCSVFCGSGHGSMRGSLIVR